MCPISSDVQYRYLGVLFTTGCKSTEHTRQVVLPELRAAAGRMRVHGSGLHGMNGVQASDLVRALAQPHLLYCAAV